MLPSRVRVSLTVGAAAVVVSIVVVSVFSKQDWSQYTSDLTSGAIVGSLVAVIVGSVLWRWQVRAESTSRADFVEEAWRLAREIVRADLDGPWDRSVTGSDRWDRDWQQVQNLFGGRLPENVPGWALAAPANKEIALTRDLLTQALGVKRQASRLNFQLGVAVGKAYPKSSFENDITRASWMALRGNGEFVDDPDLVLDAAEKVLAQPDIDQAVHEYLESANALRDLYDQLWTQLEPVDDQ